MSPEEDAKLKDFIQKHVTVANWIALPHKAGLKRCGKSCRLRWLNYLRPNIKHGEFSEDEDRIICNLYANIGSRWSVIASQLPGRTDNDIKNYWNTKLKKKLLSMPPNCSLQKKQSFSPSITLQSPPLSDIGSLNYTSSSSYNYNPNFINVSNSINPLFSTTTDLFSQHATVQLSSSMISNEKNWFGFQNLNFNKYIIDQKQKEKMVVFGYGNEGGGGCMVTDQIISYNNDHDWIKQEHKVGNFNCFGDQNSNGFMRDDNKYNIDEKQKGCLMINNSNSSRSKSSSINVNGYLMNDDDDENKTTHIISDGFFRMIDGSN